MEQTGRCLCGAVAFTVEKMASGFDACHCEMCRRWSGGPLMAIAAEVRWTGEEKLRHYKSSDWAERVFCGTCGSNLYYRVLSQTEIHLAVGCLDDQTGLELVREVFVDSKPEHYALEDSDGSRVCLTGAELFALSGAS